MIELLFLAIALAMDAFAVSIGLGAKQANVPFSSSAKAKSMLLRLALMAALYFGIAQGVMPLIGYLLGSALLGWLASAAPWIGCIILVVLGAKMLYEAISGEEEEEELPRRGKKAKYEEEYQEYKASQRPSRPTSQARTREPAAPARTTVWFFIRPNLPHPPWRPSA